MTQTQLVTVVAPTTDKPDHIVCLCTPDVALCGVREFDQPHSHNYACDHPVCVVCEDLDRLPCPRCGY
jgi:hypothetical protein